MKLQISKNTLLDALNKLYLIIEPKTSLPIMGTMLFDVKKNELTITATNNCLQVKYFININTIDEFKFCVSAKLFTETIRLFSISDVDIILKDNKIQLKNGSSKYHLACEEIGTYPEYTFVNSDAVMRINSDIFISGLTKTSWIVDEQNKVPVMGGISIKQENRAFSIVGCLDYSIMHYDAQLEEDFPTIECVIPKQSAVGIKNVLSDKDCKIMVSNKKVKITSVNCEIVSIILEYKYPDTKRFLKLKSGNHITINRLDLIKALSRLKLYTDKEESSLVNIIVKDGHLVLNATTLFGDNFGEEKISISDLKFETNAHFNLSYIYNGVIQTDGENVDLYLGFNNQPMYISSTLTDAPKTEFILGSINPQ